MYRKGLLLSSILLSAVAGQAQQDYPIHPVNFTQVQLTDAFWSPRIETNRTVTIPASFARCEETGRVKNFTMAAEHRGKFCTVFPFDDTDIYKTLEGAGAGRISLYRKNDRSDASPCMERSYALGKRV